MSAEVAYLDTSAFVKTISTEAESAAMSRYLAQWPRRASSKLLRLETLRTAHRRGPDVVAAARIELHRVELIDIDDEIMDRAAALQPVTLRSLDAIHLATADMLGSNLGVIVTYDQRLVAGARALGLEVQSPV